MNKMFVLLQYYNMYDQQGGYFAGIFATREDAEASVHHIGRADYEYDWYEIEEVEVNKFFDQGY